MVYNSGRSSGGRYDGGSYASSYGRRDSAPRRSAGNAFGALDPPSSGRSLMGSGRSPYGGGSVSPWASGEGPSRHSWSGSDPSLSGGRSSAQALLSQLAPVAGGAARSNETLTMAASLVTALLQQNQQQPRQEAPQPFGPPRREPMPYDVFGSRSGPTNYRGGRSSSFGRSEFDRPDYGSKFDRRDSYGASQSRGRATVRGRGTTRGRGATVTRSTVPRRTDIKPTADKASATKKKPEPKKAIKTTQEALDEAKAAALEKQMEKAAAETTGEGAEAPELMAKGEEATATTEPDKEDDDTAKDMDTSDTAAVKDSEKVDKKQQQSKFQRDKIDSKYLSCAVCGVANVSNEQGFVEHVRGRKHMAMMELAEQKLEQTAKLIRLEIQVSYKRAELERQRRGPRASAKDQGFCGMCNIRVFEDLNEHRSKDPLHAKLKKFLHPRCCNQRFSTPVMYERHLVSFQHFRKEQLREKENEASGTDVVTIEGNTSAIAAKSPSIPAALTTVAPAAGENGEAAAPAGGDAAADDDAAATTDSAAAVTSESAKPTTTAVEEQLDLDNLPTEEATPALFEEGVAVGTRQGRLFTGVMCTLCKIATPCDNWLEHCRSRIHYNRFVMYKNQADRARRDAAEQAEIVVVADDEDEEEVEKSKDEASDGEARGVKRAAEDDLEEGGAEAKIAAADPDEVVVVDEVGCDEEEEEVSEDAGDGANEAAEAVPETDEPMPESEVDMASATEDPVAAEVHEPVVSKTDDTPVAEKPAAEKPTAEKAAEKPATEKPAAEKPAAEKPAAEKPAAEKPAAEKPAAEKPAAPVKPAPTKMPVNGGKPASPAARGRGGARGSPRGGGIARRSRGGGRR